MDKKNEITDEMLDKASGGLNVIDFDNIDTDNPSFIPTPPKYKVGQVYQITDSKSVKIIEARFMNTQYVYLVTYYTGSYIIGSYDNVPESEVLS